MTGTHGPHPTTKPTRWHRLGIGGVLRAVRATTYTPLLVVFLSACANRPGGTETGPADEDGSSRPPSSTATSDATSDATSNATSNDGQPAPATDSADSTDSSTPAPATSAADSEGPANAVADVLTVEASGSPGDYTFAVTLRSPDTGCDRYADWWEVVTADGSLLYRRILAHSHVDEQPFTRNGGPIPAEADTELWVRAHMHGNDTPEGYGGQVLRGSVQAGFTPDDAEGLAPLHEVDPLPDRCAF
ncbi:MAG: hypothetical protein AAGF11_14225 [Myxococcota bacterium]